MDRSGVHNLHKGTHSPQHSSIVKLTNIISYILSAFTWGLVFTNIISHRAVYCFRIRERKFIKKIVFVQEEEKKIHFCSYVHYTLEGGGGGGPEALVVSGHVR